MSRPKIAKLHYKEICRVLYNFIRILCKSNSASARYCFRYSHIMLLHFSLDIGVLDAFAVVVDNNHDLLQNHLTKDHIKNYVELLCHGKMHPEHLKHLQRFCAYKNTPISRVQVSARQAPLHLGDSVGIVWPLSLGMRSCIEVYFWEWMELGFFTLCDCV